MHFDKMNMVKRIDASKTEDEVKQNIKKFHFLEKRF